MHNYKVLFSLRLLKKILDTFVDTFFVIYFLEVSSENIIPLGIYHIILVLTIYLTMYFCRNFTHSRHRISLIRIAIVMDILYFSFILILQDHVPEFMLLLGVLRGLEEGLYYAIYNIMESDGIKDQDRVKFIGHYKTVAALFLVVFPITLGAIIQANGFVNGVIAVLFVAGVRVILSFMYKDRNLPRAKKTNMKAYYETVKNDQRFRRMNTMDLISGVVSSCSAFSYIFTVYIMMVFPNNFSFGVATAFFSITTVMISFLFSKYIKKKQYPWFTGILTAFSVISPAIMIIECNPVTIILARFWQEAAKETTFIINDYYKLMLSNDIKIRRKFKTEFWVNAERWLMTGRVISGLLFISMAFMESWTAIMFIFTALIAAWGYTSIRFQKSMQRGERKAKKQLRPAYDYLEVTED